MIVHDVQQGTTEWEGLRNRIRRTASMAPIMMGVSPKMNRAELVRMAATGSEKEFSDWVRLNLLEKGHEIEAAIRPWIEDNEIEDDLYPLVVTDDQEYMLASVDGITEDYRVGWECKSWNTKKAEQVENEIVPEEDRWQVVQSLVITGADHWVYTISDGTAGQTLSIIYKLNDRDEKELLAGWRQFDEDVANYVHTPVVVTEPGAAVLDLPAVTVQVSGQISVIDNFRIFENALRDFIDNQLIRSPQTDQDFADLEAQVKALKRAEDALNAAETHMLAQVSAVDAAKRVKDMLFKLTRDNRLMAEKLVASEKMNRRAEIIHKATETFNERVRKINAGLGRVRINPSPPDFAGAMKGKKTIQSLRDAADTELSRATIAVNQEADTIRGNLAIFDELATDYPFLFNDIQQIASKQTEDFTSLVKIRVQEHKDKERNRLEEEKARIRAEEEAKARRDAEAKIEAERAAARKLIQAEESAKLESQKAEERIREDAERAQKEIDHTQDDEVPQDKSTQELIDQFVLGNGASIESLVNRFIESRGFKPKTADQVRAVITDWEGWKASPDDTLHGTHGSRSRKDPDPVVD